VLKDRHTLCHVCFAKRMQKVPEDQDKYEKMVVAYPYTEYETRNPGETVLHALRKQDILQLPSQNSADLQAKVFILFPIPHL